jgi:hypothetical protein
MDYVILEHDNLDSVSWLEAHHVYKSEYCEVATKRIINFPFFLTGTELKRLPKECNVTL